MLSEWVVDRSSKAAEETLNVSIEQPPPSEYYSVFLSMDTPPHPTLIVCLALTRSTGLQ